MGIRVTTPASSRTSTSPPSTRSPPSFQVHSHQYHFDQVQPSKLLPPFFRLHIFGKVNWRLNMSSIAALLQAAEYLERREREVEHGYASIPGPFVLDPDSSYTQISNHKLASNAANPGLNPNYRRLTNKPNNRKPQGNRSTHNELEKNRRAHLRNCLEKLKDIVPVGGDSSRHTTLGLLNKAKLFIKALEEKERKASSHRENLLREQRYLRRRLELLSTQVDAIHKRRSVSECSTSTVSSTHSSHSESDEHEVDVIGYGGASDDDHSSVRSGTSDGGVTVTTWRQLSIGGDAWKTVLINYFHSSPQIMIFNQFVQLPIIFF